MKIISSSHSSPTSDNLLPFQPLSPSPRPRGQGPFLSTQGLSQNQMPSVGAYPDLRQGRRSKSPDEVKLPGGWVGHSLANSAWLKMGPAPTLEAAPPRNTWGVPERARGLAENKEGTGHVAGRGLKVSVQDISHTHLVCWHGRSPADNSGISDFGPQLGSGLGLKHAAHV